MLAKGACCTYTAIYTTPKAMNLAQIHIAACTVLFALFFCCCQTTLAQGKPTLMQHLLAERPALADLVTKAGLTPMLSANDPLTLLAPPEAALQRLEQEPPVRLRAILSNHIMRGTYLEQDLKDGASIRSVGGTTITVCRKDGATLVNGMRITEANQQARNGILHGVSGLLSR